MLDGTSDAAWFRSPNRLRGSRQFFFVSLRCSLFFFLAQFFVFRLVPNRWLPEGSAILPIRVAEAHLRSLENRQLFRVVQFLKSKFATRIFLRLEALIIPFILLSPSLFLFLTLDK